MTREQLQARLDAYLAAETKILRGQEYVIGQGETARRLRRADLAEITKTIADLQRQIDEIDNAAAGRRRVLYTRPMN
ncbi:MAG TPA: hypothetical protein PKJ45_12750 [Rubrivivax sp.]|nr:hypothetical protein [Rubrivivax sp.]